MDSNGTPSQAERDYAVKNGVSFNAAAAALLKPAVITAPTAPTAPATSVSSTTSSTVATPKSTPTVSTPSSSNGTVQSQPIKSDPSTMTIAQQKAAGLTGESSKILDTKNGFTLKAYDTNNNVIYVKPGMYVAGASPTPKTPTPTDVTGKVNITDISKTGDTGPSNAGSASTTYTDGLKDQVQKYQDQQQNNYQKQYDQQKAITDDLQKRLDALDPTKDPNYAESQQIIKNQLDAALDASSTLQKNLDTRQKYNDQLVGLMTDIQNEVNATKNQTGLASILSPRLAQAQSDATAKAAILQAGISAIDGQISTSQSYIDKANTALTNDRNAKIDYYNQVASLDVMKKSEYSNFIKFQIDTTQQQIDDSKATYDNVSKAMTDPKTAQMYADAGVTLNDSVDQINKKLGNYQYKQEVATQDNTMTSSGFKEVNSSKISTIDPKNLISYTDSRGQKHYYEGSPTTATNFIKTTNGIYDIKNQKWIVDPTYGTPTGNDAVASALNYKDGQSTGLQCGEFINQVAGIRVGNGLQDKINNVDKFGTKGFAGIQAGDVIVQPIGKYGHVALVTGINEDGSVNVKEANYNNDGKISSRTLTSEDGIYGYIRPTTATGLQINAPSTTGTDSLIKITGLSPDAMTYMETNVYPARTTNAQRASIKAEVTKYANAKGIDTGTFAAQFKANNETLQSNIKRFNNTKIAENEVKGTADLLINVMNDADFKGIKATNLAKFYAGEQVNDPIIAKYSFHLNQLKNELALFFSASAGKASADVIDNQDAAAAITDGLSANSLQAFRDSLENSTAKMKTVLQQSVDDANNAVWNLFGVSKTPQDKKDPLGVSDTSDPFGLNQ